MRTQPIATRFGVILLAWTLLVPLAYSTQAKADKPELVTYKKTTDSKGAPVELKLHVFKPKGWTAADQRPAIVFFFGGGWVSGKPQQFYPHCQDLAKRGFVAMSAEYRVRSRHGTTPRACVEDGKSAVSYIRTHAHQLGIDPNRIVSAGGSAGGHVAACTGVLKNPETEDAKERQSPVSSTPNLMVLFNPVISTGKKGYGNNRVKGDPLVLSPLHQAHKGQPPSMIFHGDADKVVTIDSVREFEKKSKALGVECVLVEYEGAKHSFFNHSSFKKPSAGSPDYYKLTTQSMYGFLKKHGYLSD